MELEEDKNERSACPRIPFTDDLENETGQQTNKKSQTVPEHLRCRTTGGHPARAPARLTLIAVSMFQPN